MPCHREPPPLRRGSLSSVALSEVERGEGGWRSRRAVSESGRIAASPRASRLSGQQSRNDNLGQCRQGLRAPSFPSCFLNLESAFAAPPFPSSFLNLESACAAFVRRMITTIGFDADDTLWHNESIFEATHEKYRALLARWHDAATIDRRLFATEMRNLELYGYGIKAHALSCIETAIELSGGDIRAAEIREIIAYAKEMLDHPVELLDGAAEVVPQLAPDPTSCCSSPRATCATRSASSRNPASRSISGTPRSSPKRTPRPTPASCAACRSRRRSS